MTAGDRPPGRQGPGVGETRAPDVGEDTSMATVTDPADIRRLRHGLVCLIYRDSDPDSIALRRLRRNKRLNAEQARAYAAWLAEQRRDVS
jgi:hypothetical protein